MNLKELFSVKLYLIRNSDNAKEVDAELDRRNAEAFRKVTRKPSRKPKYRMVDYDYENNRWDLGEDWPTKK